MADTERTTLYAPDGRTVSVLLPTVITRLKAQGYTEHAPSVLHLPAGEVQTPPTPPPATGQHDDIGTALATFEDNNVRAAEAATMLRTAVPPVVYDPGEHTVAEVEKFLRDNPDLTDQVVTAERAGRNRSTITGDKPAGD